MIGHLDYVKHLSRESARFLTASRAAVLEARVPACPEWDLAELVWHLSWVQWWWATIVREHVSGPEAGARGPARPATPEALFEFFERSSAALAEALAAAAPTDPAWTWSTDQTVGFISRRQAHEVLIHRVDAEQAAGAPTAMDPVLSADGVDEALRVIYAGMPSAADFVPERPNAVRLRADDTGDSWLITLGTVGAEREKLDFRASADDGGTPAAATISGNAADLDCWLWHRAPLGPVEFSGDETAIRDFTAALVFGG